MKRTSLFRLVASSALVCGGILFAPTASAAQQGGIAEAGVPAAAAPAVASPDAAPVAGPRAVQAGITRQSASLESPTVLPQASNRNVTWMIVGGAAIVVGSVVGGDAGSIIMITGAVIAVVGLLRYLQ